LDLIATLVIATWVHNEPASLMVIQESKLPDSFYNVVEQGIEPMIEVYLRSPSSSFLIFVQVIHGILNAMGALSLNQIGQNLLQNRLDVIPTIFSIFTSELHTSSLQEKSNAALIGGDMDELVRHHPWLRPTIFKSIAAVLERIEILAQEYQSKPSNEGHFDLIPVPSKPPVASTSSTSAMETDQATSKSEEAESSTSNIPPPFDLHEMPIYQFLNNFSKVCYHKAVFYTS
jgi:E3 ubiquitin-protein ligase HUWE1